MFSPTIGRAMKLETFDEVRASITKNPKRKFHLLLGNGFSVAYNPTVFSYNALHDFVSKMKDDDIAAILGVVETHNFEVIMRHLDSFSALVAALDGDCRLKQRLDKASEKLKRGLLDAVMALHPEHVFVVPEDRSKACAAFLKTFLDTGGSINSTNYDLLLYWVLMRNKVANHVDGCGRDIENDTGERMKPENRVWSNLIWGKHRAEQNVFYLHGALPLFDSGVAIVKEECDAHDYLRNKVAERMARGEYPIFVTAGDGQQKLRQIRHNQYLTYCYDRFCELEGTLVTFGFGFGASDDHVTEAINRAAKADLHRRLWSIYIGVYSESDEQHIRSIAGRFQCKVRIYDAKTADVWKSKS